MLKLQNLFERAVDTNRGVRRLATLFGVALLCLAPINSQAFTAGCAPPSTPSFPSGNQFAQNLPIPPLGFGLSTRASSCPNYTNVRLNTSQTLPPGVTLQLQGTGSQSVRFVGTPTTVGDFGNLSIEVTENGTTWAPALSVRFVVASCLNWNGGSNQRFPIRYPGGESFFSIPPPQSGVPYTLNGAALPDISSQVPTENYPASAYCPISTWTFEYDTGPGNAALPMASVAPTPLSFSISGTPSASGNGGGNFCGTPDGQSDANAVGRNALGQSIASLRFCFSAFEPSVVNLIGNLPVGTVGQAYLGNLLSNGALPTSFSLQSGNLPPGLTLASDGGITGVPTQPGSFTFVGAVTAQNGNASGSFTIIVNAAPTAPPASQAVPALQTGALLLLGMLLAGLAMRRARSE